MSITVLIENTTVQTSIASEHGLSFFIDCEGFHYIFNTGQSGHFLQNANILGLDPGDAAALILSHAHYDHCGGVRPLFNTTAFSGKIYVGPGFWDPKRAVKEGQTYSNGIDFDREWLEKQFITQTPANLLMPADPCTQIGPHCFLVHSFVRANSFETNNPRFLVERNRTLQVDDFRDEIAMIISLDQGLVVLLACAHPGLVNMLVGIQNHFNKPLLAVLGGSHLKEASSERLKFSIDYLNKQDCQQISFGHCTGETALDMLKNIPAYTPLHAGAVYKF